MYANVYIHVCNDSVLLCHCHFLLKLQGVSAVDVAAESVKTLLVTCPDVEQQLLEAAKKGDLETVKVRLHQLISSVGCHLSKDEIPYHDGALGNFDT